MVSMRCIALFAVMFVSACADAPIGSDSLSSGSKLTENFSRIVFSDEYDQSRQVRHVKKWTKPLRITVTGAGAARYRPVVVKHAKALEPLIGLPINVLEKPDGTQNITIFAVPWDDLERVLKPHSPRPEWVETIVQDSSCAFIFTPNNTGEITRALIAVSTDERFDRNASCLLEEMTQVLGLPNDSEIIRPSVFNAWDGLDELTENDKILVRTLYDKRIKAGMDRNEALRIAQPIIEELSRSEPGNPW